LNAAVTLDTNAISADCADTRDFGSNGFSGGLEFVNGELVPVSPGATIPEPATGLLLGFGLFGLFVFRRRLFVGA
jgi:hypothetical protein